MKNTVLPLSLCLSLLLIMSFFSSKTSAADGRLPVPYPAPDAEAQDHNGHHIRLNEIYARGLTLVYFYPKADTPGCTAQACSLRDAYTDLTRAGIQVIGVSTDQVESQKKFAEKYELPFTLLADPEGTIVEAFGVKKIPLIGMASRQAFLIKDGKVVWHDAKASTAEQAADVLAAIKTL
jgi:peroxiredoxin Q/BCP